MNTIRCFIFNELQGAHPSWSLAVMAVNERDARDYIRAAHGSGKLIQKPQPGANVTASCGATTEAAQAVLREQNEREYQRYKQVEKTVRQQYPDASNAALTRMIEGAL